MNEEGDANDLYCGAWLAHWLSRRPSSEGSWVRLHVGTLGKSFTCCLCASAWNSDTVSVLCREPLWVVVDSKMRYRNSLNERIRLRPVKLNLGLLFLLHLVIVILEFLERHSKAKRTSLSAFPSLRYIAHIEIDTDKHRDWSDRHRRSAVITLPCALFVDSSSVGLLCSRSYSHRITILGNDVFLIKIIP